MPTSFNGLVDQTFALVGRAFTSIGNLLSFLFNGFLAISPLPDEVDFLLVCLVVIWVISLLARLFRGK
jgi:hypothetical protein